MSKDKSEIYRKKLNDGKYEVEFLTGDIWKGEYSETLNLPNGSGEYFFKSGDVFTGRVENDIINGFGVLKLKSGEIYRGEFVDNLPNGIGTWSSPDGYRYIGKFKNGYKHGKNAEELLQNGDKFVGEYENGERKSGTYTKKDKKWEINDKLYKKL